MAIVVESFSTMTDSGNPTSVVIEKPSGTQSGDLLYVFLPKDAASGTWTGLDGFTEIEQANTGQLSTLHAYKVAGSSEPATYTFTTDTGQEICAQMLRLSGVDTSDPINISSAITAFNTDAPTAPDVTTDANGCLIVRCCAINVTTISATPATQIGSTLDAETPGSSQNVALAMSQATQATAGATGTAAFTAAAVNQGVVITIAFNPAPAGGGTVGRGLTQSTRVNRRSLVG